MLPGYWLQCKKGGLWLILECILFLPTFVSLHFDWSEWQMCPLSALTTFWWRCDFFVDEEDNVTTWDSILLSNKISPGGGVAKVTFLAFDSSSAPIVTIHHLSTLKVCFCAFWAHALEQLLQKATTPFFSQNWWPRSPWGNTMWIMAQWQCPVASSVATDLLNQAMCTALHQHITMAIKMSSEGGIFQIYNVLYEYYKYKQKTMLWSLTTNGEP